MFPAGDIPAISLVVAEVVDCASAAEDPVVLIVTLGVVTAGAATGLGTVATKAGTAN